MNSFQVSVLVEIARISRTLPYINETQKRTGSGSQAPRTLKALLEMSCKQPIIKVDSVIPSLLVERRNIFDETISKRLQISSGRLQILKILGLENYVRMRSVLVLGLRRNTIQG